MTPEKTGLTKDDNASDNAVSMNMLIVRKFEILQWFKESFLNCFV